jgi:4-amino-4-deoxy-L-arabinose transferase-like glycosyltransferase
MLQALRPTRLAALAIVLRLLLPALVVLQRADGQPVFMTNDSVQYLTAARSIVEHGRYDGERGPELFRPPGYPLLLTGGVLLAAPVPFALLVQGLLGGIVVLLVHRCARMVVGEGPARAAALLAACDSVLVAWSAMVMAETLLAACVAGVVLLWLRFQASPSRLRLVALGAAAAATAYAKPVALFLPPCLALALVAFPAGARRAFRDRLADGCRLSLVSMLVLLPWVARNGLVAGYWGFSSQFDRIVSFSAPASVDAALSGRPYTDVRTELRRKEQTGRYEYERGYGESRRRGAATLLAHAATYLPIHAHGMGRTLFSPGGLPYFDAFGLASARPDVVNHGAWAALREATHSLHGLLVTTALLAVPHALALCLALWGTCRRDIAAPAARAGLAAMALTFVFCSGGPWGQSRFRAPIVPILSVLAACGLEPRRRPSADGALQAAEPLASPARTRSRPSRLAS